MIFPGGKSVVGLDVFFLLSKHAQTFPDYGVQLHHNRLYQYTYLATFLKCPAIIVYLMLQKFIQGKSFHIDSLQICGQIISTLTTQFKLFLPVLINATLPRYDKSWCKHYKNPPQPKLIEANADK